MRVSAGATVRVRVGGGTAVRVLGVIVGMASSVVPRLGVMQPVMSWRRARDRRPRPFQIRAPGPLRSVGSVAVAVRVAVAVSVSRSVRWGAAGVMALAARGMVVGMGGVRVLVVVIMAGLRAVAVVVVAITWC
jgi:hypothetical protein